MKEVSIWTDGSALQNPGPGGWGAIIECDGVRQEMSGSEKLTTNNRMELMAAIAALEALHGECCVTLTSDSQYVVTGFNEWMKGWRNRGWRTGAGKPVKNIDLWKRLDRAAKGHVVTFVWVKGHNGHLENELCDGLARAAAETMR